MAISSSYCKTKSVERKYEMAVVETKDGEYLVTKWPCPGKYENYERITIIRDERMIAEFVSCD
jgi:hypothetical protein